MADIFNEQTFGGNHGWGELRQALENAGFSATQITETAENDSGPSVGVAIAFQTMDLSQYDVIVFGSNNAVYSTEAIDAVENFIRGGGGALFISDANFGSDWADAPDSDQQFLDRFDLVMNQDQGTYVLRRSDGDFNAPEHPILAGVDAFDGEGVSPIVAMQENHVLVAAQNSTRVNMPPFGNNNQGQSRAVTSLDGVLTVLQPGLGRLVGHFDRNTFFNLNGAGTSINRFDNMVYAINLFTWLADTDPDLQFRNGFENP
ncbi:MAG: hypothetical protein Tsb0027_22280 [Wenzhouxiangellaceae bacterium]